MRSLQANTHLSEFGAGLFFLHPAVGHQVVEDLTWGQRKAGGVETTEAAAGGGRARDSPPLAYSITRYRVFSVSMTSKSFTGGGDRWGGGRS